MILDLDANATYSPSARLQGLIASWWGKLGNPSSLHRAGQRARAAIEEARQCVRELVGASPRDLVIFTSGATEANNLMIHQASLGSGRIVTSSIEHMCILEPLAALSAKGGDVHRLAPRPTGSVDPESLGICVNSATRLISIMAANNETGVVNDLPILVRIARSHAPESIMHSDAAQIIGKLPFSFRDSGLDAITISGHKFGALSGVGALIVREGTHIEPMLRGGAQEAKFRGGTENVLAILSIGEAAREVLSDRDARGQAMRALRDRFEDEVKSLIAGVEINGYQEPRLPNTSSLFIPGVRADDLVVALDLEGALASSGAACSSGKPEPSHVLIAMNQSPERVRSTIRISFRGDQPIEIASRAATILARIVAHIRKIGYPHGGTKTA